MIVALDCDGVLSDFLGRFLAEVFFVTGKDFEPDDVIDYQFKCLELSKDEERLVWERMRRRAVAASLNVLPGAVEGVQRLRDANCEIYIVTSPLKGNPTWSSEREEWLYRYFRIEADHVIHTSAKHMVAADVLIDDTLEQCREFVGARGRAARFPAVLFDAPYNRTTWYPRRAKGWGEVLDELVKIDREMGQCG